MARQLRIASTLPTRLLRRSSATKRIVQAFAERSNMVYFGHVSQRSDEHHILRGLTLSNRHVDAHYCIGTFKDYDAVFVERSDSIEKGKPHRWHIIEIDLKTKADLPHMFIGSSSHGHGFHQLLRTKYPHLSPAVLAVHGYPDEFTHHYSLYVTPAHLLTAENLITPDVALKIGQHFKGLVIEVTEQALYIYSERSHLSGDLLDVMLANGVWLARMIDENSQLS